MAPKKPIKTEKRTGSSSARRRSTVRRADPGADSKSANRGPKPPGISAEERYKMIARLAYLRAEKRGFAPGHELDDWLRAESEVDQRLRAG